MKKEPYGDYAKAAYRLRARMGSADQYRQMIRAQAIHENTTFGMGGPWGSPTEAAVIRNEKLIDERKAILEDLEAADRAMDLIAQRSAGGDILKALRIVYMEEPDRPLRRGEVNARAQAAAEGLYVNVATIYRWLRLARMLFAQERGLRLGHCE